MYMLALVFHISSSLQLPPLQINTHLIYIAHTHAGKFSAWAGGSVLCEREGATGEPETHNAKANFKLVA